MKKRLLALLCTFFILGTLGFGQIYPRWIRSGEIPGLIQFKLQVLLKELSAAPSGTSGYGTIYVLTSDNNLYFKNSSGVVTAWGAFPHAAVQTATGDGTTTIDWGLGDVFYFTFGAQNETFTFTAPPGVAPVYLVLKQDGTGSRTATWPGTVLWPGNVTPTLTTTANYVDVISLIWDGTSYHGIANYDFR